MSNLIVLGKQRKINFKRLIYISSSIFLLTVVVFSLTGSVGAEPETVLTGCLNMSSGELRKVALGLEPFAACNPTEKQVTWSSGVPGMESRLIALEEQIADLESDLTPLDLTVHCPDESIQDALNRARNRKAHVTITIEGVCIEDAVIARDNTTLRGASPGDGLQAPSPDSLVLTLARVRRIYLEQLTINGGSTGLYATRGGDFWAENLNILGATQQCVVITNNATGTLVISTMENCPTGLLVTSGGSARMMGGLINNSEWFGVSAGLGGNVSIQSGAVIQNSRQGVNVEPGGTIGISDSTIENNEDGIFMRGGQVTIGDGSVIQNNMRLGVNVNAGGTALLQGGTRISNNGRGGVAAGAGSSLAFGGVIIEFNGGDGIDLGNGATAQFRVGADSVAIIQYNLGEGIEIGTMSSVHIPPDNIERIQVIGNTGTAVECIEENVFQITNKPGIISGNGFDVVECVVDE